MMTTLNGYTAKAKNPPRTTCTTGAILTDNASDGFITSLNIGSCEKYAKYLLTIMKNMPKPRYVSTCTVMNLNEKETTGYNRFVFLKLFLLIRFCLSESVRFLMHGNPQCMPINIEKSENRN